MKFKYRIIASGLNDAFAVDMSPANRLFSYVSGWNRINVFSTVGEAQKYCLDCIEKDKLKELPSRIIEEYKP